MAVSAPLLMCTHAFHSQSAMSGNSHFESLSPLGVNLYCWECMQTHVSPLLAAHSFEDRGKGACVVAEDPLEVRSAPAFCRLTGCSP